MRKLSSRRVTEVVYRVNHAGPTSSTEPNNKVAGMAESHGTDRPGSTATPSPASRPTHCLPLPRRSCAQVLQQVLLRSTFRILPARCPLPTWKLPRVASKGTGGKQTSSHRLILLPSCASALLHTARCPPVSRTCSQVVVVTATASPHRNRRNQVTRRSGQRSSLSKRAAAQ